MKPAVIEAQLARDEEISERVAVVVAHPDDEIVSFGSWLPHLKRLRLIHLTDGAPRDLQDARREGFARIADYAAARRRELHEALRVSGAAPESCSVFEYPDKESVNYLPAATLRLTAVLAEVSAVITHPYENGHPDHDAAAFAVHAACRLLARAGAAVPRILELSSYHLRDGRVVLGEFWPDPAAREHVKTLSEAERDVKAHAVAQFVTQRAVLGGFPIGVERFRPAPVYDFTRQAPPGAALYDRFGWRITSEAWCRHAVRAQSELGLGGAF